MVADRLYDREGCSGLYEQICLYGRSHDRSQYEIVTNNFRCDRAIAIFKNQMHPIASKCDLLPKTMKNSDLPSNLIVYDGVADPPKLDRDRSLLLLPSQPNAQPLRLDRTVTHRYNYIEGYVQLTLKLQPIAAQQIVVTNQLSENSDRIFFAMNEVIEGVYLQLLLGRTSRELGEVTSKPYTGIQVLLLDVQEYFSHPIHVKIATICTLRECLKNSNPISVSS